MAKFCTRCGTDLKPGDLYCGECGLQISGAAADPDEPTRTSPAASPGDDFFADWDRGIPVIPPEPPPQPAGAPDEARTESLPTVKPHDTAVLPTVQPQTPYLAPGGQTAAAAPVGVPGPSLQPQAPPRRGFPLGATFALLGALAVVVSALLPWTTPDSLTGPIEPRDLSFVSLIDQPDPLLDSPAPVVQPTLGLVLLGAGLVGALVALLTMVAPVLKFLRRLIGLLTLGVVALFVVRMVQVVLVAGDPTLLWDYLGVGVYVASAGGLTQLIAGKWFGR